jgi:hypothetical protein
MNTLTENIILYKFKIFSDHLILLGLLSREKSGEPYTQLA